MTKEKRLEQYGITSDKQITGMIDRVCDIFGNGKHNNAKVNIEKLIRHESHFGNITDYSKEHGEGLTQIDRKTFYWILNKINTGRKYRNDLELFNKYYGFHLNSTNTRYEDLRYLPDVSIVLCRLRYKFVPELFPNDDDGMYEYYKKWWNGNGDASREKWDNDTKECHFKVGD